MLVVNAGSSSVKLAVLDPASGRRALTGLAERVGTPDASVRIDRDGERLDLHAGRRVARSAWSRHLLALLTDDERASLVAVGHRVVHGGPRYSSSVVVDDVVSADLEALIPLAPLHLPGNLAGIDAARAALPDLPQVVVFDTAFHRTMPSYAAQYAVPKAWRDELDVRRYGFHGTSHRYVGRRAAELLGRAPSGDLGLVTLHLGNGCSAAAVRGGLLGRHHDGLHPARGPRDGHPQRRHRPGRDPVRRRASRGRRRRGRTPPQHRVRPARRLRHQQRHAHAARGGGRGRRRRSARRGAVLLPRGQARGGALGGARQARRRRLHRRDRRALRGGPRRR